MHFLLNITNKSGDEQKWIEITQSAQYTGISLRHVCGWITSDGHEWYEEAEAWADEKSQKEPHGQAVEVAGSEVIPSLLTHKRSLLYC